MKHQYEGTTEEREFWQDVGRTQRETAPLPEIDFKALVADSREAFWRVRKAQIEGSLNLAELTTTQLAGLSPEEVVWAQVYNSNWQNKGFARAALRFFDPIRGFLRDLASSTLPTVATLTLLFVTSIILVNRKVVSGYTLPVVLAAISLIAACAITIYFFKGEGKVRDFGLLILENSTGALVGGLIVSTMVIGLFAYGTNQRTKVRWQIAQAQKIQDEIQLSSALERVMPVANTILTDRPPGTSLSDVVDKGLKESTLGREAGMKKIKTTPDEVIWEITENSGGRGVHTSRPIRLTFTDEAIDISSSVSNGYRITPLTFEGTDSGSVKFITARPEADATTINLTLSDSDIGYTLNKNGALRFLKGSNLLVTYDRSSNTIVGMQPAEKNETALIYYSDMLSKRLQRLSASTQTNVSSQQ